MRILAVVLRRVALIVLLTPLLFTGCANIESTDDDVPMETDSPRGDY